MVFVQNVMPMPTLILWLNHADVTKDLIWLTEPAQLALPTNTSNTLLTNANAPNHTIWSTELAKPAKTDGNTTLRLNAATRRTHATSAKPWSTEYANVCRDTEEIPMDSVNLLSNAQPTVPMIRKLEAVYVFRDLSHDNANVSPKSHVSKTVTPWKAFATAMMDSSSSEASSNAENVEITKFTTVRTVCAISDLAETLLENVSKKTSFHPVDWMKSMTASKKFVSAKKITTESTVNVSSQSPVEPTHTGMVPNVNAILD